MFSKDFIRIPEYIRNIIIFTAEGRADKMKKILAVICVISLFVSLLCSCVSDVYGTDGFNETESEETTGIESDNISLSEEEIESLKAELEEEKETDPIFDSMDGVDPPQYWDKWRNEEKLPEDFIERVGSQGIEDIMCAYARRLWLYEMATDEYNRYAYYYGDNSPYIEGTDPERSEYESIISLLGGKYPASLLDILYQDKNNKALCVSVTVKEAKMTALDARDYYTQEQLDKYYPDGDYSVDYTWYLLEIKDCYTGNKNPGDLIALLGIDYWLIDEFLTPEKTFMLYLYDDPNKMVEYEGEEMQAYQSVTYGVFDITDGTVRCYSNLNDIIQYEGLTPEEFVKVTLRLRAKYLDYNVYE